MTLKIFKKILGIALPLFLIIISVVPTGCGIYRFRDVSIPDSINLIRVNPIQNKASYINPRLAPALTDRVKQKISTQTKMRLTNADDADWDISPTISGYSFSTAGISNQRVNTNRLNVNIVIEVNDRKAQKVHKYDVSRSFDYDGRKTLQQAEGELYDEMIRSLSDDTFNRIFSNW